MPELIDWEKCLSYAKGPYKEFLRSSGTEPDQGVLEAAEFRCVRAVVTIIQVFGGAGGDWRYIRSNLQNASLAEFGNYFTDAVVRSKTRPAVSRVEEALKAEKAIQGEWLAHFKSNPRYNPVELFVEHDHRRVLFEKWRAQRKRYDDAYLAGVEEIKKLAPEQRTAAGMAGSRDLSRGGMEIRGFAPVRSTTARFAELARRGRSTEKREGTRSTAEFSLNVPVTISLGQGSIPGSRVHVRGRVRWVGLSTTHPREKSASRWDRFRSAVGQPPDRSPGLGVADLQVEIDMVLLPFKEEAALFFYFHAPRDNTRETAGISWSLSLGDAPILGLEARRDTGKILLESTNGAIVPRFEGADLLVSLPGG
ncbi:hypothetical protein ACIRS1_05500 [Kitasatospora sp. NPDC101176]|uniref:hypothetical protein n=1 Tax=Kitasatospora sp. NPDC101176 TaxID=3364099 RepID=UPI0037F690DF